jgi:NitT/TauT family transport system ATP-binding protein
MVELQGLSIDYRIGSRSSLRIGQRSNAGQNVVRAVECANALFPSGGISAIVGPSGCGKTSIVHAVAGLLAQSAGQVLIEGGQVLGIRPRTAVIFQDYGLLPWLTVEGNVELPLIIAGLKKAERIHRVQPILDELGLSNFGHFYPGKLSGGMKQRVAVARALAPEPDLLLMDEPFSSLDALTRESAQDFLLEVRRSRNMTIVVVTHSIEEAVYLAESVFVMTGRNPGTISSRFDIAENNSGSRFGVDSASRPDFRAAPKYLEMCAAIRSSLRGAGRIDDTADGQNGSLPGRNEETSL